MNVRPFGAAIKPLNGATMVRLGDWKLRHYSRGDFSRRRRSNVGSAPEIGARPDAMTVISAARI